jgi:hypothetical protein
MSQFGRLIENDINTENLYSGFVEYFKNPIMTKIKNENNLSIYMCKTYCLLGNECRYLVAMIKQDPYNVGTNVELSDLQWVCFQTRTMGNISEMNSHIYDAKRNTSLNCKIVSFNQDEKCVQYDCVDFPVVITLLKTKKMTTDYIKEGTLLSALETYQTIITLKD